MRPLMLEIEGLNSFFEKQTIDFQRLTEAGLFGIFGPTGSGKSTILDAMTMALYGEIPRYSGRRKRQSINTSADSIRISFSFSLAGDDCVYTVDRTYKIKSDNLTGTARLVKNTNGEVLVISDKATQVDKDIIDLIGLNYADFSCSVILPQGKFSQFLLLENIDRRKMLERIFHLEQYGERLTRLIKARVTDGRMQLAVIEKALSIYGEINESMIEEARQAYEASLVQLEAVKAETEKKSKETAEYQNQLQTKLKHDSFQERLNSLESGRELIEQKRRSLAKARNAESISPEIISFKSNLQKLSATEKALESQEKALQDVSQLCHSLAKEYESHSKHKAAVYPGMIMLETQLRQAVERLKELDELGLEINRLLGAHKALQARQKELAEKKTSADTQRQAVAAELDKITAHRNQIAVDPALRKSVQEANEILLKLQGAQKNLSAAEVQLNENNSALTKISHEIQQLSAEAKILEEQTATQRLLKLQQLEEKLTETRALLAQKKARLDEAELHSLSKFSQQLEDGQPCPLCGSTEHPRPYLGQGHVDEDISSLKEGIQQLTLLLGKLATDQETVVNPAPSQELQHLAIRHAKAEERLLQTKDLEAKLTQVRAAALDETAKLTEELSQYSSRLQISDFAAEFKRLLEADEERHNLDIREQEIRKSCQDKDAKIRQLSDELSAVGLEMEAVAVSGREKREQLNKLKDEITAVSGQRSPQEYLRETIAARQNIEGREEELKTGQTAAEEKKQALLESKASLLREQGAYAELLAAQQTRLTEMLKGFGFGDIEEAEASAMENQQLLALQEEMAAYDNEVAQLQGNLKLLSQGLNPAVTAPGLEALQNELSNLRQRLEDYTKNTAVQKERLEKLSEDYEKVKVLLSDKEAAVKNQDLLEDLAKLVEGEKFVEFIARRQLRYITFEASARLKEMTNTRYALELDGSDFVIRDDFNGGARRSPRSLSGGETFMASLCLALALSSKIQMKNNAPLDFFFLDEGFGSLDNNALDVVMSCLERLQTERIRVGIISHVDELKSRVPLKLVVTPPNQEGGTRVIIE